MANQPKQRTALKLPESLQSTTLGLNLNREQASMLLQGIEFLSDDQKKSVVYTKLKRDLESIVVIWDRRIKNIKILEEKKS
jgi:hypothetical protein